MKVLTYEEMLELTIEDLQEMNLSDYSIEEKKIYIKNFSIIRNQVKDLLLQLEKKNPNHPYLNNFIQNKTIKEYINKLQEANRDLSFK